ncbi:putative membrane protein [Acinetobacter baumannii 1288284]|nr:putative membrane protein [Acinetobacter baumannii 1288284]
MAQFAQNRYFPVCAFVLLNYPLFHPLIFFTLNRLSEITI